MRALQQIKRFFGKDYPAFFLACVSCVSLSFSLPASAQSEPAAPAAPKYSNCREGEAALIENCFEAPQGNVIPTDQMSSIQSGAEGITMGGQTLKLLSLATSAENERLSGLCQQIGNSCKTACDDEAKLPQNLDPPPPAVGGVPDKELTDRGVKCKAVGQDVANLYGQNGLEQVNAADQAGETTEASEAGSERSGGGGDIGQMVGPLLAVGAGIGALCLMGTICKDEEKKEGEGDGSEAGETPYTATDCANKDDAYQKAECSDIFLEKCQANTTAKDCDKFASQHCGLGESAEGGTDITPSSTGTTAPGLGSSYCQVVISQLYCDGGGKDSCPSCLNLVRMTTSVCLDNPSVCLPQMTYEDKQKAQVTCPTDPLFSNPLFMAGQQESGEGETEEGTTLSGATLPASDGSTTASVGESDGVTGKKGRVKYKNAYTASLPGGYNPSGKSSDAVGVGGLNGMRDIASTQVASDIAPAMGSSLFARHSKVVSQRCQSGDLNNCGPRSFTATAQ